MRTRTRIKYGLICQLGPINKNVLSKEVDYTQDLENDSLVSKIR